MLKPSLRTNGESPQQRLFNSVKGLLRPAIRGAKQAEGGLPVPKKADLRDSSTFRPDFSSSDLAENAEKNPQVVDQLLAGLWRLVDQSQAHTSATRQTWEMFRRFHEGQDYIRLGEDGFIDPRASSEELADWISVNELGYIVQKVVALATQGDPRLQVLPRLPNVPKFAAAAKEGNAVLGHEYRRCGVEMLRQEQTRMAAVTSTAFRYWRWNPSITQFVPTYDEYGQIAGLEELPLGGLDVELIPAERLHLDLGARREEDSGWAAIEHIKPLSWVQRTFNEGKFVDSDGSMLGWDRAVGRMEWDGHTTAGNDGKGGSNVRVIEFLSLPRPDYPNTPGSPYGDLMRVGFRAMMTRERLLELSAWGDVWEDSKRLPLSSITYRPRYGSPFGLSLVGELQGIQSAMSEAWTRVIRRVGTAKTLAFLEAGQGHQSGLIAKLESFRDFILLPYNRGETPPQIGRLDPVIDADLKVIQELGMRAQAIAGLPDALMGKNIPGVDTGVQYSTMIEMAGTQHRPFIASIEEGERRFAEAVLSEYAGKAAPDLLLSLNPKGNDSNQQMQGHGMATEGIENLTSGGFAGIEVYLSPSSGVARSPETTENELYARFTSGAFGDPLSPMARRAFWSLSSRPEAMTALQFIDAEEQQMAEQQAATMQAEQAAQGGGVDPREVEMMKAESAAGQAQMKADADMTREQMKLAAQAEAEERRAMADEQKALTAHELGMDQREHEAAIREEEAERGHQRTIEVNLVNASARRSEQRNKQRSEERRARVQARSKTAKKPSSAKK